MQQMQKLREVGGQGGRKWWSWETLGFCWKKTWKKQGNIAIYGEVGQEMLVLCGFIVDIDLAGMIFFVGYIDLKDFQAGDWRARYWYFQIDFCLFGFHLWIRFSCEVYKQNCHFLEKTTWEKTPMKSNENTIERIHKRTTTKKSHKHKKHRNDKDTTRSLSHPFFPMEFLHPATKQRVVPVVLRGNPSADCEYLRRRGGGVVNRGGGGWGWGLLFLRWLEAVGGVFFWNKNESNINTLPETNSKTDENRWYTKRKVIVSSNHHFQGAELLVLGSVTLEVFFWQKKVHTCCWTLNSIKIDVIPFHSTHIFRKLKSRPCFFVCYSKDFENGRLTSLRREFFLKVADYPPGNDHIFNLPGHFLSRWFSELPMVGYVIVSWRVSWPNLRLAEESVLRLLSLAALANQEDRPRSLRWRTYDKNHQIQHKSLIIHWKMWNKQRGCFFLWKKKIYISINQSNLVKFSIFLEGTMMAPFFFGGKDETRWFCSSKVGSPDSRPGDVQRTGWVLLDQLDWLGWDQLDSLCLISFFEENLGWDVFFYNFFWHGLTWLEVQTWLHVMGNFLGGNSETQQKTAPKPAAHWRKAMSNELPPLNQAREACGVRP